MKVSTDSCLFGAWVAQHLREGNHALDIGAGTGLLSLMICQKHSLHVDAVEIEEACHKQLTENVVLTDWKDRITPIHSDVIAVTGAYDTIFSNPPFYENQLQSDVHNVNLARHQNRLTLEALFRKVNELLTHQGTFYLLMPAYRKQECIDRAYSCGLHPQRIAEVKQSVRHKPFRVMFSFKREDTTPTSETITIKDQNNEYTPDFSALLKDYYL